MNGFFIHGHRRCFSALLAVAAVAGCHHEEKGEVHSVAEPPTVRVTQPDTRDIVRVVGQPSFVDAYERTSIYPKLAGFIERWYVDIGDKVTKDQVLADLFVPEIIEEWKTKGATVEYDKKRVDLALRMVDVAKADVEVAEAGLKSAKALLAKYKAETVRWESEVDRLTREVKRGVIDPQGLLESQNRLRASTAERDAAAADVAKAEFDVQSKKAKLGEDEVAVRVAEADVKVADSDFKRLGAWADNGTGQKPYIKLFAPFDGVVVARNANTWDFVLPAAGDPSADTNAPFLSPSSQAAPIYVVDRTDVLRIYVDVPEHDANFIRVGTQAVVLIRAFRDQPIVGTVTRTSWALSVSSRTMRAEIDLPNTHSPIPDDVPQVVHDAISQVKLPETSSQILPGMYAYGKVIIERPKVRALPVLALTRIGDKTFCFRYENGKAVRTEIQTGLSDNKNKWIEVINWRRPAPADVSVHNASLGGAPEPTNPGAAILQDEGAVWVPFDGTEKVIMGDLSILTDGEPVHVAAAGEPKKDAGESEHAGENKHALENKDAGEDKDAGADPHGI
ncbi:MAG TPA: HlyD family efflux transporter periplasmic adaptor subunit [Pirellulales bacterium]|nr:HlyD family efflux transporter periplasmic adaptor subunit [Pirellulales bacterium]